MINRVGVRMPEAMIEEIDHLAKKSGGISRSDQVRIIIQEYLDEHEGLSKAPRT